MENNYTINDDIIDIIPEDSNIDDAAIPIGAAEDDGDHYKEGAAIPIGDGVDIPIGSAEDDGDNYKEGAVIPIGEDVYIPIGSAEDDGGNDNAAISIGDSEDGVGDATDVIPIDVRDVIPIDVGDGEEDAEEEDPLYIIKKMELLARASYLHQYGNIKSPIHQVMEINL